jgi:hypothetical protein
LGDGESLLVAMGYYDLDWFWLWLRRGSCLGSIDIISTFRYNYSDVSALRRRSYHGILHTPPFDDSQSFQSRVLRGFGFGFLLLGLFGCIVLLCFPWRRLWRFWFLGQSDIFSDF